MYISTQCWKRYATRHKFCMQNLDLPPPQLAAVHHFLTIFAVAVNTYLIASVFFFNYIQTSMGSLQHAVSSMLILVLSNPQFTFI